MQCGDGSQICAGNREPTWTSKSSGRASKWLPSTERTLKRNVQFTKKNPTATVWKITPPVIGCLPGSGCRAPCQPEERQFFFLESYRSQSSPHHLWVDHPELVHIDHASCGFGLHRPQVRVVYWQFFAVLKIIVLRRKNIYFCCLSACLKSPESVSNGVVEIKKVEF